MQNNPEDVAVLVGQTGPLNGQRIPLKKTTIVGRDPSCDVVIADRQVSRRHARFSPTPEGVLVEDLRSKNGTHVNGVPVENSQMLQDGDVVQVALAQQFVFISSDATIPLDGEEFDVFFQVQPATTALSEGQLRLEKRSRRVFINDKELQPPLSFSQFRLLEILYDHQGRVVTREDIIAAVWGEEQAVEVSEQALDALVRRLRDRLAEVDPLHAYVVTVRGHGLRLDNPPIEE